VPVLLTERLALRRFTEAGAGNLAELGSDPAVMRYLGPVQSRAEVEHDVLPWFLAADARCRDFGFWAAETRAGGSFVGWFGLRPVRPGSDPMLGWPDAAPPGHPSSAPRLSIPPDRRPVTAPPDRPLCMR
jgi:RimJ/RimL family protein N-acetyltransferase